MPGVHAISMTWYQLHLINYSSATLLYVVCMDMTAGKKYIYYDVDADDNNDTVSELSCAYVWSNEFVLSEPIEA